MSDTASRITTANLVAHVLNETGATVTPHQLKYWQRLGVIARPRQERIVGDVGSRTTYPSGTEVLVCALVTRRGRTLDELVRIAWEHERPLFKLKPALLELLRRSEPAFRAQFRLWQGRSRKLASARARQARRQATQIHRRHRSIAAYVVATLMFGDDPKARHERADAGAALWELLPTRRWRLSSLSTDFAKAIQTMAQETSLLKVKRQLAAATSDQLALIDKRMASAWRPAKRLGVIGGDESWFAFFLLMFAGLVVSPSFSRAYFDLGVSRGSPVSKLAGAVKHLALEEIVAETVAAGPLPETFESDDLPPEYARYVD